MCVRFLIANKSFLGKWFIPSKTSQKNQFFGLKLEENHVIMQIVARPLEIKS